jgi:hypothetical protein
MMTMKPLSHAGQKLGFTIHALAFAPAMIAMLVINLLIGPPWWVIWPAIGWSIGLLSHGWFVLGPGARRAQRQP